MTTKLNCWEFKNCGREKGGLLVDLLGECPVASAMKYDGQNGGIGGGRTCWMAGGNACHEQIGSAGSTTKCQNCDFYLRVVYEEQEQICHRFFGRSKPVVPSREYRRKLTTVMR
ncbi:MAG TPA: hypothetical protein PLF13_07035 [candidate division Zixibacteria bacterium]|nr:hypothetical protein [candidate division Zixibacteria bacterium]